MKNRKIIYISGIIILAGALIALFTFIKLYNKPHADVSASIPDYTVTAKDIVEEFKNDEQKANGKYLDKIIQVEGVIKDITVADGNSVVTLTATTSSENIICNMEATENKKILHTQKGQKIIVRGVCTGFLLDVMLVRTVIIN